MKSSGIGGQAVLEGIMMKNRDDYAVAVRNANHEIIKEKKQYKSLGSKYRLFGLPFIRGIFSFIDSMILGRGRRGTVQTGDMADRKTGRTV